MRTKRMTSGATLRFAVALIFLGAGAPLWAQGWNVTIVGLMPMDSAYAVAINGSNAYVADWADGLRAVDVSSPATPVQLDSYGGSSYAWNVAVDVLGNYAYVVDGDGTQLHTVDISNPSGMLELGSCYTPDGALDVAVSGNYAYVANEVAGLTVIQLTLPNPTYVTTLNLPGNGWASGVAVSGDYAYVADGSQGLQKVDISVPSSPVWQPSWPYAGAQAMDVAVSGNYAYVADWGSNLLIIDLTNPGSPAIPYNTPGYGQGIAVSGSHAYLADYNAGLRVINVSSSTNPVEVGYFLTLDIAWGVAVSGNYVYVAQGDFGIYDCSVAVPIEPEKPAEAPAWFALSPPHPNPFNPTTVISFELRVPSFVKFEVFNVQGVRVVTGPLKGAYALAPVQQYPAGIHQIPFDGSDLPTGIYFAKLTAGEFSQIQKLVLLK